MTAVLIKNCCVLALMSTVSFNQDFSSPSYDHSFNQELFCPFFNVHCFNQDFSCPSYDNILRSFSDLFPPNMFFKSFKWEFYYYFFCKNIIYSKLEIGNVQNSWIDIREKKKKNMRRDWERLVLGSLGRNSDYVLQFYINMLQKCWRLLKCLF
jgi:hypothetical protein